MFGRIVSFPPSFFALLSGIFVSLSTTAFSEIALNPEDVTDMFRVIEVGSLSLIAALEWFLLAELVPQYRERIRKHQEGLSSPNTPESFQEAVRIVAKAEGRRVFFLVATAFIVSVVWIF